MRDFQDTIPVDESEMHSYHCENCGQAWTARELKEDGQHLLGDGAEFWRCPGCGFSNSVDGESGSGDDDDDDDDDGGLVCPECGDSDVQPARDGSMRCLECGWLSDE